MSGFRNTKPIARPQTVLDRCVETLAAETCLQDSQNRENDEAAYFAALEKHKALKTHNEYDLANAQAKVNIALDLLEKAKALTADALKRKRNLEMLAPEAPPHLVDAQIEFDQSKRRTLSRPTSEDKQADTAATPSTAATTGALWGLGRASTYALSFAVTTACASLNATLGSGSV